MPFALAVIRLRKKLECVNRAKSILKRNRLAIFAINGLDLKYNKNGKVKSSAAALREKSLLIKNGARKTLELNGKCLKHRKS